MTDNIFHFFVSVFFSLMCLALPVESISQISQIMSATKGGGEGIWQMLTLADEGGRGGLANADIG